MDGTIDSAVSDLRSLIAFPSVSATSNEAVTDWAEKQLIELGFSTWRTHYDDRGVRKANVVAVRHGPQDPQGGSANSDKRGLAYFCHTDVVPAEKWIGPDPNLPGDPFTAVVTDDRLYGRGACDMKGSLAAMLAAARRVPESEQTTPLWIVCTADEEVGFWGAKHIAQHCSGYRQLVKQDPVAIIGEPTELEVVYAHKGIRGLKVSSTGRAGHSATRFGINANEKMVPLLGKLLELCHVTRERTDLQDDRFDPPTLSWNFGVSDHSEVVNITPERSDAWVCIRTMPDIDGGELFETVRKTAEDHGLSFEVLDGCDPMWTDPDAACVRDMMMLSGQQARTVCYATDGGVLTELTQRVVIGPGSIRQAHTVDEWISLDQLSRGIDLYERAIRHWCCGAR